MFIDFIVIVLLILIAVFTAGCWAQLFLITSAIDSIINRYQDRE